jgi:D-alanyl-D-alanine carboxypeptidase/D-alanyl-D-alanine-endopeptidase (penicillin-binding protein 4)
VSRGSAWTSEDNTKHRLTLRGTCDRIRRKTSIRAFLALVCAALTAPAGAADVLPPPIASALARATIPQSAVALFVQDVDASKPALAFNAGQPLNPASTIKLVTTFAALELLGPSYTWKTEAYLAGPLAGDVLEGDLVLKGYGDPRLTIEHFWLLLRSLRARGLREIRGDLVLDRSYFEADDHDTARFDSEPLRPYNVGADALLVNYKAVRFQFVPDAAAKTVTIVPEPRLAQVEVANGVRTADGTCGDWRAGLKFDLQQQSGGTAKVSFSGTMPASCGERYWNLAFLSHREYVHGVFRQLWEEMGGALRGRVRDGTPPAGGRAFATYESPSAAEVVRDMNKFSNNVMARQVFLTLSAETTKLPGRYDRSARAVQSWLAARGLEIPELVLENGSGLSRAERISAGGMGRLLLAAYRSSVMPEFIASMPLVAYDGTLRKRMKFESVAGQAHIKTGSLFDVRAIAGYVLDRNARRHVVVFIVNHANAGAGQAAQEAVLRWVYESGR